MVDRTAGDDLSDFPIEKARLRSIWYLVIVSIIATIGYGWALRVRTVSYFITTLFKTLTKRSRPDSFDIARSSTTGVTILHWEHYGCYLRRMVLPYQFVS